VTAEGGGPTAASPGPPPLCVTIDGMPTAAAVIESLAPIDAAPWPKVST
jgi:hypothetical protein